MAILIYAEDIVLLATNKKGLSKLQDFRHSEQLNINHAKSKVVVFGKRSPKFSWSLGERKIEQVPAFKYFGVFFMREMVGNPSFKIFARKSSYAILKKFHSRGGNLEFQL